MEVNIESKIGTIQGSQEKIFAFLSDFTNFKNLVPADKVKNFQATRDECTFEADGIGSGGFRIVNREPHKTIKISWIGPQQKDFFFWIQLQEPAPYNTKIKLTIKSEMNMMMKMMAEKPLKKFLDTLVDQISKMTF
jgi:carbon monoxide dehydrogenase subunit G